MIKPQHGSLESMEASMSNDETEFTILYRTTDLVCFSHLRWNFVFQRPQHLLSRFAPHRRVFFVEEPMFEPAAAPSLDIKISKEGVHVVVPKLPAGYSPEACRHALATLLDMLIEEKKLTDMTLWYYTPMALEFSSHLKADFVIYDCMDELTLFKNAPPQLLPLEQQLLAKADLVFTGGHSLFEAKRHLHPNIHPFPSSIDHAHFNSARDMRERSIEPADQIGIKGPRLGFYGVIDERMDLDLLEGIAWARPDWQFIMIGPVVKIDPLSLPKLPNIHYLGMKDYSELPAYLAGWDVAILPFARNESTRFISPTKTPEYLAAGCPVVSTSIRDVVHPYGTEGIVAIADTTAEFITAAERVMKEASEPGWISRIDEFLSDNSWDLTFGRMANFEQQTLAEKSPPVTVITDYVANEAALSGGRGSTDVITGH